MAKRKIVVDETAVGRFIERTSSCIFNALVDHSIGVVDSTLESSHPAFVRGGVLYQNYTGTAIWMHAAGREDNWPTPTFMWTIFHYPFVQLGVRRIYGVVAEDNHRAREIYARLGFCEMTSLPDMFATGPALVITMVPESCVWLKVKPRSLRENRDGRRQGQIGPGT